MRLLAALLLAAALPAAAQDYERENRWAAEVVPSLVVGDALQLKLPAGREFLGSTRKRRSAAPRSCSCTASACTPTTA